MKVWLLALILGVALASCGLYETLQETQKSLEKVNKTLDGMDKDGDSIISAKEILLYLLAGWLTGRGGEAVGARLLKKKNGKQEKD